MADPAKSLRPSSPSGRSVSAEDAAAFLNVAKAGVNPFINHTWGKLPISQRIKIFIVVLTLFPLRLIATSAIILLVVLFSILGTACLRKGDLTKPLPALRRLLIAPIRPLLRLELAVLGIWITCHGRSALKTQAPIVVSNHVTLLDPIFLVATLGACPVSAIENLRFPIVSQVLIALQCVFVVRDKQGVLAKVTGENVTSLPTTNQPLAPMHHESAVARITERAQSDSYGPVLIFPEGSCTNGTALIQFKSGAFVPGLPVQPVAVRYPFNHFDPSWTPGVQIGGLLFLLMCQVYTRMDVTFLPVIVPSPEQRANAPLFASAVRDAISAALPGVYLTQHSFDDVLMVKVALAARYPTEQAVVELNSLRAKLSVDTRTAVEYLKLFMRIDVNRSGFISMEQFVGVFSGHPPPSLPDALPDIATSQEQAILPAGATQPLALTRGRSITSAPDPQVEALRRLFTLLDTDGNGHLDYREFLIGLCVVNERGSHGRRDALRLAFEVLDTEGHGSLDRAQFGRMVALLKPDLTTSYVDAIFAEAMLLGQRSITPDNSSDLVGRVSSGRITAAQFVEWGDTHGDESELFRKRFLGFSGELSMLADLARISATSKPQES